MILVDRVIEMPRVRQTDFVTRQGRQRQQPLSYVADIVRHVCASKASKRSSLEDRFIDHPNGSILIEYVDRIERPRMQPHAFEAGFPLQFMCNPEICDAGLREISQELAPEYVLANRVDAEFDALSVQISANSSDPRYQQTYAGFGKSPGAP